MSAIFYEEGGDVVLTKSGNLKGICTSSDGSKEKPVFIKMWKILKNFGWLGKDFFSFHHNFITKQQIRYTKIFNIRFHMKRVLFSCEDYHCFLMIFLRKFSTNRYLHVGCIFYCSNIMLEFYISRKFSGK